MVRWSRLRSTIVALNLTVFIFTRVASWRRRRRFLQVMAADRLTVSLLPASQGGRLSLSLSADATEFTTESGFDLADNHWHDVDIRFHQDFLQIKLDGLWMTVVNASLVNRSPLFQRTVGDNSEQSVTLGRGFTGCLLEGPSLTFSSLGRLAGCPIPLGNESEFRH